QASAGINPTGQSIVCTTNQRQSILHRAKERADGVLPLRRAFSKPTVVGQIEQEIRILRNRISNQLREDILKADQNGDFCPKIWQLKRPRSFTWSETAFDPPDVFQEWKPARQRQILTKHHQPPLVVPCHELSSGGYQKGTVEKICISRFVGILLWFGIVGAKD